MAALTFGELWRQLHLEYSTIDPMLCRQWVLDAYKRACSGRQWGFLITETQLLTTASRSVAVTLTQGLTTVTSVGLFLAADGNRQIRFSGIGIPYTISFTDANTITLDRAWEGASGPATATIFDAYAVMPADFDCVRTLVNPTTQRPMPWFLSRQVLDYWDPNRTSTDSTARMIVSHRLSTQQTGRILYEYWPYPTSRAIYPMTYYRRPDVIADTDPFVGVLSTRCEHLLSYARYRAVLYPGTPERKNPGYNPAAARLHTEEWEVALQELDVRDDDQFMDSIEQIDWRWVNSGLPYDTNLLRQTDASGWQNYLGHSY